MRPPNARFCPACGLDFDADPRVAATGATSAWLQPAAPRMPTTEISFWVAIKFGAGFVIGAAVVSIAFWVVIFLLLAIGISLPAASLR